MRRSTLHRISRRVLSSAARSRLLTRMAWSRAALSGAITVAMLGAALALPASAAAEGPGEVGPGDEHQGGVHDLPGGWLLYDGGALLAPDTLSRSTPLELLIDYFTTGSPAVKWRTDESPTVQFCTAQRNRPAYLTAAQFRDSVERGMRVWSEAEAAIGFDYAGDCASPTWGEDNRINEIGWDDSRNVVRRPAAAITFGRWADRIVSRDFRETDIILDHEMEVSRACLDSVIAHELGHALGFGHSTSPGDLMVRSFDPTDDATCPGRPSAAEVNFLRGLYGRNGFPVFASTGLEQEAGAGAAVRVGVTASDPDGDRLSYSWTQTAGPAVSFTEMGDTISFTAPGEVGTTLRFRVEARDPYLHSTPADVTVHVVEANLPPADAPYLEGLGVSADGSRLALTFTEASRATEYRFCATLPFFSAPSCQRFDTPRGEVTWDTVLGAAGEGEAVRVLTSGYRDVTLQACNDEGCIQDEPTRIRAGGLRWAAHRVDYDYFAMTQDLGGTGAGSASTQFTIAFVQNMTGTARDFKLYAGTEGNPTQTLMMDCGRIAPADFCVGYLAPGDRGHGTHVTIRSERTGSPAIENRIRVR